MEKQRKEEERKKQEEQERLIEQKRKRQEDLKRQEEQQDLMNQELEKYDHQSQGMSSSDLNAFQETLNRDVQKLIKRYLRAVDSLKAVESKSYINMNEYLNYLYDSKNNPMELDRPGFENWKDELDLSNTYMIYGPDQQLWKELDEEMEKIKSFRQEKKEKNTPVKELNKDFDDKDEVQAIDNQIKELKEKRENVNAQQAYQLKRNAIIAQAQFGLYTTYRLGEETHYPLELVTQCRVSDGRVITKGEMPYTNIGTTAGFCIKVLGERIFLYPVKIKNLELSKIKSSYCEHYRKSQFSQNQREFLLEYLLKPSKMYKFNVECQIDVNKVKDAWPWRELKASLSKDMWYRLGSLYVPDKKYSNFINQLESEEKLGGKDWEERKMKLQRLAQNNNR